MDRSKALLNVKHVVDNTGNGREIGRDQHAKPTELSWLIGWRLLEGYDFRPVFVAVNDYLGGSVTRDEAIELATDYLIDMGLLTAYEEVFPDWVVGPGS